MTVLLIFFTLAIGFSFLCSVLEAVLLSITPNYIRVKESQGSTVASDLKKFKQDIDRPLSAILTLNTIAHTVGAIGVGAQAAIIFKDSNLNLFGFEISLEGVVAGLMTLAILILSEIIPKTIGANNWRQLAPFTVRTLKVLNIILWPFIVVSQLITKKLKKEKEKSVLSRTDFLAMTYAITEEGVIDEGESKIIHNVLAWNNIATRDVMTPRTVLTVCQKDTTIEDFCNNVDVRYSRIPLYTENMDDIESFILKSQALEAMVKGHGADPVESISRKMTVLPETMQLDLAFRTIMAKREHVALIVDEFGGVEGIITLEDIMETVLGAEIMDETDKVADLQEMAKRKGKRRLKDG